MWLWFFNIFENCTEAPSNNQSDGRNGVSVALHIFLPLAGLCILWGRRDIFTRLLLQIDRSCISVCCPSLSKRETLLRWISDSLPYSRRLNHLKTIPGGIPSLWKDGSTLCILINSIIPGACPNPPRHWKKPPAHAQALAYKYLGIVPVFTENDFEEPLTPIQERKFLLYLESLREAIKKFDLMDNPSKVTSRYLARGMGLFTGEQHKKTTFYIYSNSHNENKNIMVYIRGPYGTQGTVTVPAFHSTKSSRSIIDCLQKRVKIEDKPPKLEAQKSFFQSLDLGFLFKTERKKTNINDIPIHVEMELDRAKITYIPNNYGMFEINLLSNGEVIQGSPFVASVSENLTRSRDCFQKTQDVINNLTPYTRKKVLSKVIDCVDKQIELLHSNKIKSPELDKSKTDDAIIKNNLNDNKIHDKFDEREEFSINKLDEKIKNNNFENWNNLNVAQNTKNRNTIKIINNKYVSFKDHNTLHTSSICRPHIAPEVADDHSNLSLREKRNLFKRQKEHVSDQSFSENEMDSVSEYDRLSVMAVLETLKKTSRSVSGEGLSPAKSLPNISDSTNETDSFKNSFLKTRDYWKNLSCRNLAETPNIPFKPVKQYIRKSADDIFRLSDSTKKLNDKLTSASVQDLSSTPFVGIEERKRMLYERMQRKEKAKNDKILEEIRSLSRNNSECEQTKDDTDAPKLKPIEVEDLPSMTHFKEAVAFFKNLEKKTFTNKPKTKTKKRRSESQSNRRYSLDVEIKKPKKNRRNGGSLKSTSEKFSVSKLYVDILTNRRGSLKGTANKEALSETLASLSIQNRIEKNDDFDNIKLNLFFNNFKVKKRKSLKSVFDVYY